MTNVFGTKMVVVPTGDIIFGRCTATDSEVQLTANSTPLTQGVWIIPVTASTYHIGKTGVSATAGLTVVKTDAIDFTPIHIPCNDASKIYILSASGTFYVTFMAV